MKAQGIYKKEFRELIERFAHIPDYYVGIGNPDAEILIVGKEGVTKDIPEGEISLSSQWLRKIEAGEPVDFNFRNPDGRPFRIGDTYTKYQKLHDYIFSEERGSGIGREVDFFKNIFITEMNVNRARMSKEASKEGMQKRKEEFFRDTEFIRQFPVVVLACGAYVDNCRKKEIDAIFGVEFDAEYRSDDASGAQAFWTHYNAGRTKLVIHTRQLSSDVRDTLLRKMAGVIREFLDKQ